MGRENHIHAVRWKWQPLPYVKIDITGLGCLLPDGGSGLLIDPNPSVYIPSPTATNVELQRHTWFRIKGFRHVRCSISPSFAAGIPDLNPIRLPGHFRSMCDLWRRLDWQWGQTAKVQIRAYDLTRRPVAHYSSLI